MTVTPFEIFIFLFCRLAKDSSYSLSFIFLFLEFCQTAGKDGKIILNLTLNTKGFKNSYENLDLV